MRVRYFEGSSDKGISAPYLFSIWVGIDTYHGYADVHVKSGKTNVNRRHWTRYCRLTAACKIIIILLFPVGVEYEKYSANKFLKRTDLVHFWIEWYRFDYHCGFVLRRRLFWNQESPLNLSNWGCLEQLWLLQNWNWSKLFMNLHLNLHFILSTVYTRLHRLEFRPTWVVKSSNKSLNFELRWITFDGELRLITSAARTRMSVHFIFFSRHADHGQPLVRFKNTAHSALLCIWAIC